MTNTPPRQSRDNQSGDVTQATAAEEKAPLRRKRGHMVASSLQLEAPQRPGFVRRFAVNTPKRMRQLEQLGYQVAQDRAGEGNARTSGLGSHIERHAGTDDAGAPYGLILMETPVEEYALGVKDKDDALKPFEAALRAGKDTTGRLGKEEGSEAYEPSDKSSMSRS